MIIRNGQVFLPEGRFAAVDVQIADGKIGKVASEIRAGEGEEILDAAGLYVAPGLVDIHLHGCVGHDFCEGSTEAMDAITGYEVSCGVTSISAATMTLGEDTLAQVFSAAGDYRCPYGKVLRGITMEGPFVSKAKKGAQNEAFLRTPDRAFFEKMQGLCHGMIRQVVVAPEEDRDFTFIREVSKQTVVSVAHTTADYDTALEAFVQGASHVTHLFNAMPSFLHRAPGVVGAAFDRKEVFAELICDGIHVHPSVVRAAFAMFGAERICMISDSMMAAGMPNGSYELGGQPVRVKDRLAVLADGTIAGSASSLMDCLRKTVLEMKIPLEEALLASTLTPARSLGIEKECGSISVGSAADLILLNEKLELQAVLKEGKRCLQSRRGE
ncbi:MAG: N-acetylglucosamine-6-phosphate deacetylase [Eubacteriales bacterium]|nr:N-acetylglucosamine-6-phosphate deacetylase [Eubacteriales bacterium]